MNIVQRLIMHCLFSCLDITEKDCIYSQDARELEVVKKAAWLGHHED